MKKTVFGLMAVAVVAAASVAFAGDGWMDWKSWFGGKVAPAAAAPVAQAPAAPDTAMAMLGDPLQIAPNDRVMGSMMAPVTMIEYASMTCPHCADFTKEDMPQVKKDWIDTGKVKYVLRDLAWDNLAVGIIKVARCAEPEKFYPMVDAFFASQNRIVTSDNPLREIQAVAGAFGMDNAKVEACVKDQALQDQVEASKKVAMEGLGIRGTPTVFVNGVRVDGAVKYDDLKKTLEAAYAKVAR